MKLIRMKTRAAGPNGVLLPDIEYNVQDDQAADFVGGGFAEYVNPRPEEKATPKKAAPKKTAAKTPAPKKSAPKKEVKTDE